VAILIKDYIIEFIKGRAGKDFVPAIPGVPSKPGYWSYETVRIRGNTRTNNNSSPVTSISTTIPDMLDVSPIPTSETVNSPILVKEASMRTLRDYMPTLRPLIDAITKAYDLGDDTYMDAEPDKENPVDPRAIRFKKAWDDFQEERRRILQAEVDTRILGRPLVYLSWLWGENAYIAAFDGTGVTGVEQQGVTFFTFQGFAVDDQPIQMIVK